VVASSSSLASSRRVAWSRFVPFVFVDGGEGRWDSFEEGPLREKEREVIVAGDGWCVREVGCLRLGSFEDREVDVSGKLVLASGGTLLVFHSVDLCMNLSLQDSLLGYRQGISLFYIED
jgi:hypothetical protein